MYKKDINLSNHLSSIMSPILEKRGIYINQLIKDWPDIISTWDLNQKLPKAQLINVMKIVPIKIIWNKKSQTGVLFISIPKNIMVLALHESTSLKNSVNKYFGYNAISDIILHNNENNR